MNKKNYNFRLAILSVFLTLFLLEILFSIFLTKPFSYRYHKDQFRLYQQGKIFQNFDGIFKYFPNISVKHEAFFFIKNNFIKEYSYNIKTNNFGLVQKNNIYKSKSSVLFLGDSFTEGVGSLSWVNKFNGSINGLQVINGGIFGAGPQQFEILEKHIDEHFDIEKVIFLYTSGDIERDPFNFSQKTLNCLDNYEVCEGNENYYGFPLEEMSPLVFLKKLKNYRDQRNEKNLSWKTIRRSVKQFVAELYIVNIPREFLKRKFYKSKNIKIAKNFKSIRNLIDKYEKNIIFIQIQTLDEIVNKQRNYYSIFSEDFITRFSDNHYKCDFDNNLDYFYPHDGHPNEKGYQKLYECVTKILNKTNI